MKLTAYEVRDDEKEILAAVAAEHGAELACTGQALGADTLALAGGSQGVTTLGRSRMDAAMLDALAGIGVRAVSTRTIGYNHIDVEHARAAGLHVSNSSYEPDGVAEFAVMLLLMALRHYKMALYRASTNDYSLFGMMGRELRTMTVGVVGTGSIGAKVLEKLSGFGCELLAYDPYPNERAAKLARYVELDELYALSDAITLHVPLLDSTHHMINAESIAKMRDGVVIVNCARGELASLSALIDGIESQKIGALGLDVVEQEEGIYHLDKRTDIITNRDMAYLRQFPNVTMTQHMAFYTDMAVRSMATAGVKNLVDLLTTGTCANLIV